MTTAGRAAHEYVDLGRQAILELLGEQLAAPSLEIEARIADERWPGLPVIVEPHHLNDALRVLRESGDVVVHPPHPTRGGRPVSLVTTRPTGRNATAIEKAAARKRLLTGRYLGWAQGTQAREAVIGPAAERVVHASLTQAAPTAGYRLANPTTGTAATFLGMTVPVGALDNAALSTTVDTTGLPGPTVAIPIEVKNLRDWLYPTNREVYQLLTKAGRLQRARPSVPMLPLLIARRIHFTTFRMFKDLGTYAIETKRQYIGAVEGGEERINEVRAGLGFLDLVQLGGSDELITRRLTRVIPRDAARVAPRWAETASDTIMVELFDQLRTQSRIAQRSALVAQLRERAATAGRLSGGW